MKRICGVIAIFVLAAFAPSLGFGENVAQLPELAKPSFINMSDTHLYICDGPKILVYSRKNYKLVNQFGKAGEGPQEFKLQQGGEGLMVFPSNDMILVSSVGKLGFYSREGKFLKEMKTGVSQAGGAYQAIGKKFAGLGTIMGPDLTMNFTINIYDEKMVKLRQIYQQEFMAKAKMTFPMVYPIFQVEDGLIYTPGGAEFCVNVFDVEGNKVGAITRKYELLEVPKSYAKQVHNYFKTNPGTRDAYEVFFKNNLRFKEKYPAIQFYDVDQGKVYMVTYMEQDGKREVFAYDKKGEFLKRLFIPVYFRNMLQPGPIKFKEGSFYQVVENEEEEIWELRRYKIL